MLIQARRRRGGSPPQPRAQSYYPDHRSGAGQLMIALNIEAFQPLAEFGARMERLIAELKSVPLAQGFEEIVYPGELEARNDARTRSEGILLPQDTIADLGKLAREWSLPLPFDADADAANAQA